MRYCQGCNLVIKIKVMPHPKQSDFANQVLRMFVPDEYLKDFEANHIEQLPNEWIIELVRRIGAQTTAKAFRAYIPKVSRTLCRSENTDGNGCGGVVEALSLIIKEKEQFVLHDGPTDGAAEHVPAQ